MDNSHIAILTSFVALIVAIIPAILQYSSSKRGKFNDIISNRRIEWLRLLTNYFSEFISLIELEITVNSGSKIDEQYEYKLHYSKNQIIALLTNKPDDLELIRIIYIITRDKLAKKDIDSKHIAKAISLYRKIEKREWEDAKNESK